MGGVAIEYENMRFSVVQAVVHKVALKFLCMVGEHLSLKEGRVGRGIRCVRNPVFAESCRLYPLPLNGDRWRHHYTDRVDSSDNRDIFPGD